MTEIAELTAEGWAKQEAHDGIAAPLTEEEEVLGAVRRAEAEAVGGTGGRRLEGKGGGLKVKVGEEARRALEGLGGRAAGWCVQLGLEKGEEVGLVGEGEVNLGGGNGLESGGVSGDVPRYSFLRWGDQGGVVFVYSCPEGSKVRDRMVYAASKEGVVGMAREEFGVDVLKKVYVFQFLDGIPLIWVWF